ncbi:hypothetical protein DMENIID0001_062410 [Sergentomyia squamirostris]
MAPMDPNSQAINAAIIANVKRHRVLYDNTVPEYSIKRYSKAAWEDVAEAVDLSENECRTRWRHLRISFLRYNRLKRASGGQHIKPYYLGEDMSFMMPFISFRSSPITGEAKKRRTNKKMVFKKSPVKKYKIKTNISEDESMVEEVLEEVEDDGKDIQFEYVDDGYEDVKSHQILVDSSSKHNSPGSIEVTGEMDESQDHHHHHHHQQEVQSAQKDRYYEIVSTPLQRQTDEENPDWNFLKSFLPDLQKMKPNQKIKFKLALCSAVNDILYT